MLGLAYPVDQAREPWFEWLHLEVRNERRRFARRTRAALGVAVRAVVDGQQPGYTLVWSGSTPGNVIMRCDVHLNFGRRLPLVFRAAAGAVGARVFNTHPTSDVWYLSEIEFVTQGIGGIPLDPGVHTLDVVVQYGDGEQLKPKAVPADGACIGVAVATGPSRGACVVASGRGGGASE